MSDTTGGVYAVGKLGKDRWIWCSWKSFADMCSFDGGNRRERTTFGYTTTKDAALAAAAETLGGMGTKQVDAGFATAFHTQLCRDRRQQRIIQASTDPKLGKAAAVPEYAYLINYHVPDTYYLPSRYIACPHRIVKRTARFIFICDRTPDQEHADDETYRIERAAFERGEPVPHRKWYSGDWYNAEAALAFLKTHGGEMYPVNGNYDEVISFVDPRQDRPAWATLLGVEWPCDAEHLKRAYREKIRSAHPDMGGAATDFIALQQAYTEALRVVGGAQ